MHPVYEYIVAVSILFLVLSYSFYAINTAATTQLSLAKEEELKPVADRLFNKILFTRGYPSDWGSNIYINESNLEDFGLLSSKGGLYDLDVDKVMRLVNYSGGIVNPLYIPPTTFGSLAGIYEDGHWTYGFRLMIMTALNISIQNLTSSPPTKFEVNITDYTGKKASNAEVRALLYVAYTVGNTFEYNYSTAYNVTGLDGSTILNFPIPNISSPHVAYTLIVSANYYGIKSQNIWVEGNILNIVVEGQYLIVNMSSIEGIVPSARHLTLSAIEFTSDLNFILNPLVNVTNGESGKIINKGRYNYRVYRLSNPITENVVFIALLVKTTGRYFFVFASRPRAPLTVDYRSHSFSVAGLRTETIYGLFRIGDSSFYAQLTVWRMSE